MKNQQILASFLRVPVLFDRVLVRTRFKTFYGVVVGENQGGLLVEHSTGGKDLAISLIENHFCVVVIQH